MATGKLAFSGSTSAVIFDAILNRQPASPVRLNPGVPVELEQIINKALEKDRRLRYQTAADLMADLKRLKRDSDSGRSSTVSARAAATDGIAPSASGGMTAVTPQPGARRPWGRIAAGALVLAVAGGLALKLRPAQALTERDLVLVGDFLNTTGEPVFEGTLKRALLVQLEQSPFLNLLPDTRVQEALGFMGRPPEERVIGSVAREVCEREGAKASSRGPSPLSAATTPWLSMP